MRFTGEVDGRAVPVEVRLEKDRYVVLLGDRRLELDVCRTGPGGWSVITSGESAHLGLEKTADGYTVRVQGRTFAVRLTEGVVGVGTARPETGHFRVCSPMPGKVVRVLVSLGQAVASGAPLVLVEAMKMENELRAVRDGQVVAVHVSDGQAVESGAVLLELA